MKTNLNPILKSSCYIADELKNEKSLNLLNKIANYDEETFNHSIRVALLSTKIGCKFKLNESEMKLLTKASLLHDIGKIFIPVEIINKTDKLTDDEYNLIKTHTSLGSLYIQEQLPDEKRLANIICSHHENFDGSGYPNNLMNNNIDTLARIIRITDTYDAMSNDRPYQNKVPKHIIYELFLSDFGHCYDPEIITML